MKRKLFSQMSKIFAQINCFAVIYQLNCLLAKKSVEKITGLYPIPIIKLCARELISHREHLGNKSINENNNI